MARSIYVHSVQEILERHLHAPAASNERAVAHDEERRATEREGKRKREREKGGEKRSEECPATGDHSLAERRAPPVLRIRSHMATFGAIEGAARSGRGPEGHRGPTLITDTAEAESDAPKSCCRKSRVERQNQLKSNAWLP